MAQNLQEKKNLFENSSSVSLDLLSQFCLNDQYFLQLMYLVSRVIDSVIYVEKGHVYFILVEFLHL